MTKSLREKAINFKDKKYVEVKERIIYFNDTFPNGSIVTERMDIQGKEYFKATVTPDCDKPNRTFTGHSQASFEDTTSFVNKTSATENAETSAVGRALAMMGIGVIDSVASVDEMKKAGAMLPAKKSVVAGVTAVEATALLSSPSANEEGLVVVCSVCGAKMDHKTGISSKTGKPYDGWFCPTDRNHPPRFI